MALRLRNWSRRMETAEDEEKEDDAGGLTPEEVVVVDEWKVPATSPEEDAGWEAPGEVVSRSDRVTERPCSRKRFLRELERGVARCRPAGEGASEAGAGGLVDDDLPVPSQDGALTTLVFNEAEAVRMTEQLEGQRDDRRRTSADRLPQQKDRTTDLPRDRQTDTLNDQKNKEHFHVNHSS